MGSNGRLLDMEMPGDDLQQGQMGHPLMTHQPLELHPMNMMSGIENEQPLGFVEAKGLSLKGMSMDFGKGKGISLGRSLSNNTSSEDEEPSYTGDGNGENCNVGKDKKESPWQRMKWTDNIVRLLIAVVASVGDEGMFDAKDGLKRKSGMLQKKGKWKMVSNIMISNGCCVSPQQCEDKFNDLNKRYKKLNDILGRETSCQVVENPSLMDAMPHLTEKAKDEVKKILSSKHLFYREMCAFHNGQRIPGCHDIDLQAHIMPLATHPNENNVSEVHEADENYESDSDESYEDDEKNVDIKSGRMEGYYARSNVNGGSSNFSLLPGRQDCYRVELESMFQDVAKSPAEQRSLIQQRMWQLEVEKVKLEAEALDLEKQRLKWLRFRSKKDRELERLKLENERVKLESDWMVLLLKQKEMVLGMPKSEMSLEPISLSIDRFQGRDGIKADRHL
ncbi:uncharacterized protein LOC110696159 [Chenopodium quinoa]|uniref:uncharacterized protein LOC110696158 n=1 Tax=Chenopodium quinoa TaxID=63459 RepID=UPI000B798921|nr:uncharacterized protein LOC110696158 [Chenopodium quinoa]XP_021729139.1 uncharacterized protein LOC110696159 [Chenopodium quinoa]